jgi:hypothetical protein
MFASFFKRKTIGPGKAAQQRRHHEDRVLRGRGQGNSGDTSRGKNRSGTNCKAEKGRERRRRKRKLQISRNGKQEGAGQKPALARKRREV